MTTSEEKDGPTPAGGVKSVAYYQDADGNPADKAAAVKMLIVEYDKSGDAIMRTYMEMGKDDAG